MTTNGLPDEAHRGTHLDDEPIIEAGPSRASSSKSLFAYFGKDQPAPSVTVPNDDKRPAPKRRKKKDNESSAGTQARLGGDGAAWSLRPDAVQDISGPQDADHPVGRKKGRRKGDDEEQERREMDKRMRAAHGAVKKGSRKSGGSATSTGSLESGAHVVTVVNGAGNVASGSDAFGIATFLDEPDKGVALTSLPMPAQQNRSPLHSAASYTNESRRTSLNTTTASNRSLSPQPVHIISSDPAEPTDSIVSHSNDLAPDIIVTSAKLACPSHPFFSRANSAATVSSKGASQQDAIDVDTPIPLAPAARPRPKKLLFAADQKATHSFFDRLKPGGGIRSRGSSVTSDATRDETPGTDITGREKAKLSANLKAPRKVHAFFSGSAKGSGASGQLKEGWGRDIRSGEEWLAPLPGRMWPGHITSSTLNDVAIPEPSERLPKRRKVASSLADDLSSYFINRSGETEPLVHRSATAVQVARVSKTHLADPAVQAIRDLRTSSGRETWCEHYRPRRASHVLGNVTEAVYLRDWLRALAVGHDASLASTYARVTRRVPRRKAGQYADGWIVDDFDTFPETFDDPDVEEDFEPIERRPSLLAPRGSVYPTLESRLGNTILLTGPHGAGKTAAVYAAAEELGWEVFEVYPGIGKRTGTNLMSLVGDVGRNHIVAQGKSPRRAIATVSSVAKSSKGPDKAISGSGPFFKTVAKATPPSSPVPRPLGEKVRRWNVLPSSSQGSQGDPIELDEGGEEGDDEGEDDVEITQHITASVTPKSKTNGAPPSPTPRRNGHIDEMFSAETKGSGTAAGPKAYKQSLVLLDEVDLLFDEESTFWPAVISLIAESRRPVILTCNDCSRVPIASLPLQTILQFEPPPPDLAQAYLGAISEREGLTPSGSDLAVLAENSHTGPVDLLDQPLPPNGNEPVPVLDLRRAITQMQLDRRHIGDSATSLQLFGGEDVPSVNRLEQDVLRLELRSFGDAWVAPGTATNIEESEVDRYEANADDLLGIHALLKTPSDADRPCLAINDICPNILEYLLSFSRPVENESMADKLRYDQTRHVRSLLPLLDPLIPLSGPLLPHSSLFTTYLPIVRSIIAADDLMELAEQEAAARGEDRLNRKTGRPVRLTALLTRMGAVGKAEYARYLQVPKEAEAAARVTMLGKVCWDSRANEQAVRV